jgi:hypothetical protein
MSSFELDREAFGADRIWVLEQLAAASFTFVTEDGFALLRNGARASYIGPCVARSPESAKLLIESCLASRGHDWYWDLLPANTGAVRCAEKFGFSLRRTLWRMRRGEVMENNNAMVYAIAGFELG